MRIKLDNLCKAFRTHDHIKKTLKKQRAINNITIIFCRGNGIATDQAIDQDQKVDSDKVKRHLLHEINCSNQRILPILITMHFHVLNKNNKLTQMFN